MLKEDKWFVWDGKEFKEVTVNKNDYKPVANCLTTDLETALAWVRNGDSPMILEAYKTQWSSKYLECKECGTVEVKHMAIGLCAKCFNKLIENQPEVENKHEIKISRWSIKYSECLNCGTTEVRHVARGLCANCYNVATENRHKIKNRELNIAGKILTDNYLYNEYVINKKSLSDIAKECSCSRQYVYKKMKQLKIDTRTKEDARELALDKNKLSFKRIDENGNEHEFFQKKTQYKKDFFKSWSSEMAYVLGVIYTDGSLFPSSKLSSARKNTTNTCRLSISQKEPELLNKVLDLMESNAKLMHFKERVYGDIKAGAIYRFDINCDDIYYDLIKLGLTPNKSLTLKFPDIPIAHVRHFIRGCWDGDGSFYKEKRNNKLRASLVSGSFDF